MLNFDKKTKHTRNNYFYNKTENNSIDNSTMNLIVFASILIILGIFSIGTISYNIAKDAIVNKLKSRDLIYIAQSINSKIDGRIARAKETSLLLSRDPVVVKWLKDGEKDESLGYYSKQKITDLVNQYDYSNSFIVSALTNHYWAENGKLIDTLSTLDPDDSWFFNTIQSKNPISLQIDYNKERNDTFVFINALVGDIDNPIGVAGVGLNLNDISEEFKSYKFGEFSNMWLIDSAGNIYVSEDADQSGENISDFIPSSSVSKIIDNINSTGTNGQTLEYKNKDGQIYDVIWQPVKSTEWKLVFQIPRSESISVVNSIKINTIAASIISIIILVFMFYLISNKISNPYKRALLLSQELELKVAERTKALNDKNEKIMDSIEYARIIQESILPPLNELNSIFREHFILWKPRDIVGGDFYFARTLMNGYIIMIGDCTGHGIPGALMTMSANSILNHIIDESLSSNPAAILKELNKGLKQALKNHNSPNGIDDGLDAGIIYVSGNKLTYAGAKIALYKKGVDAVTCFKGNSKGIGYKNTGADFEFNNIKIEFEDTDVFYLATDGFTDQNGGEKDLPYGKRRLQQAIQNYGMAPLQKQKDLFEAELKNYMGCELQRDDITLIGFKPYRYSTSYVKD